MLHHTEVLLIDSAVGTTESHICATVSRTFYDINCTILLVIPIALLLVALLVLLIIYDKWQGMMGVSLI